jgi:hypothetical protein
VRLTVHAVLLASLTTSALAFAASPGPMPAPDAGPATIAQLN